MTGLMSSDELGAHVSTAGGVENAPARAVEIESTCLQLFTKQPNRWVEPVFTSDRVEAFRRARDEHGITTVASHDSYLSPSSGERFRILRSP